MERNRDLRRATVSPVNSLPRRRQRITTLRDLTDKDRRMELQETVRLEGDEREFSKKRRIDKSVLQQRSDDGESYRENITDSSDEECYEDDRTNQLSPPSSSKNHCGLRKLRSSPVLRAAVDEMFVVPVPRRARSSSAKRLHEYCNSDSGGFGEDLSFRRSSQYPVSPIGPTKKKKMRSVERITTPTLNPPELSVIQDDIEIEVAEALFDLMKQSQPKSHSSLKQSERDSVVPAGDVLKMSKADGGKDEINAFSFQNEPSVKVSAETVLANSMKELDKERTVVKEKFSDESAQDLVSGDGFVNKVKVGSPKESESPSCVKVNACDIQDPTLTKAVGRGSHYDANVVEAKKETKLEIDLMVSPLPPSPERGILVDMRTDTGAMAQAVRNRREMILKDGHLAVASRMQEEKSGEINSNRQLNLNVEKHNHDTTHHQAPSSLLPFPYGMSGWAGGVSHSRFMWPPHAVLPPHESAKSSMIMQPPQFKFSESRPKRCATHQYLAHCMNCHQQLLKKSLSSGSTGLNVSCRAKSLNLEYITPEHDFIPGNPMLGDFQGGQNLVTASIECGKDKSSDAAAAFNATKSCKPLLQQASHSASASSFLHGPSFVLPFGHHQATMMAPANSSGSPQSASLLSNSVGRLPVNFASPNASTAMSLNLPMFPSDEAASYMATLHNNGCSVPISTNIATPSFKGPPSMAFFNPSLYPPPAFNVTRDQQQLTNSHSSVRSASQNTILSQKQQQRLQQQTGAKVSDNKFPTPATVNSKPEKLVQQPQLYSKTETEINCKNGAHGFVAHSDPPRQSLKGRMEPFGLCFGSNASATPLAQNSAATMFHLLPDMSGNGNPMIYHKNLATGGQSFNYLKSDCSAPPFLGRNINFPQSSVTSSQPYRMRPASVSSDIQQHQLIQVQATKSSTPPNITAGSFFTSCSPIFDTPPFFPRSATPQPKTHINFGNGPTSFQGHQFIMKSESVSQRNNASTPPPQEAEKPSPGCRQSILSTHPSQLPELNN